MPTDDETRPGLSRRDLFRRAGLASAAAVTLPAGAIGCVAQTGAPAQVSPVSPAGRGALEFLTAAEADTLETIVARLIPSDEHGPGASEAGAARYIDRALGGALASSRDAYRGGLAALDRYAQATKGSPFARLPATDQDAILTAMETNAADGFVPDAATFFNLLRAHTIQGTFCDPYYGGNTGFVGWDLIRYPGVRIAVGPGDQALAPSAPTRQSAYDFSMFSRSGDGPAGSRDGGPDGR